MKIQGENSNSAHAESSNLRAKILLVEDELLVRESTALLLRDLGYEVVTAAEAREALGILEGDDGFDLVISDVAMPGTMNGTKLSETIRERHSGIEVILFSAYPLDELLRTGAIESDTVLLPKPFRVEDLQNAIAGALARVKC